MSLSVSHTHTLSLVEFARVFPARAVFNTYTKYEDGPEWQITRHFSRTRTWFLVKSESHEPVRIDNKNV